MLREGVKKTLLFTDMSVNGVGGLTPVRKFFVGVFFIKDAECVKKKFHDPPLTFPLTLPSKKNTYFF